MPNSYQTKEKRAECSHAPPHPLRYSCQICSHLDWLGCRYLETGCSPVLLKLSGDFANEVLEWWLPKDAHSSSSPLCPLCQEMHASLFATLAKDGLQALHVIRHSEQKGRNVCLPACLWAGSGGEWKVLRPQSPAFALLWWNAGCYKRQLRLMWLFLRQRGMFLFLRYFPHADLLVSSPTKAEWSRRWQTGTGVLLLQSASKGCRSPDTQEQQTHLLGTSSNSAVDHSLGIETISHSILGICSSRLSSDKWCWKPIVLKNNKRTLKKVVYRLSDPLRFTV